MNTATTQIIEFLRQEPIKDLYLDYLAKRQKLGIKPAIVDIFVITNGLAIALADCPEGTPGNKLFAAVGNKYEWQISPDLKEILLFVEGELNGRGS